MHGTNCAASRPTRTGKAQGKNPPLAMHKRYTIVLRGTAVLGCCTFPTWNGPACSPISQPATP